MSRGPPGDGDAVVGPAGGGGDGRRTQNARRGKRGRQLPTTGGAGRKPVSARRLLHAACSRPSPSFPVSARRRVDCLPAARDFDDLGEVFTVLNPPPSCKYHELFLYDPDPARNLCERREEAPARGSLLFELRATRNTCTCENKAGSTPAPVRGNLGKSRAGRTVELLTPMCFSTRPSDFGRCSG